MAVKMHNVLPMDQKMEKDPFGRFHAMVNHPWSNLVKNANFQIHSAAPIAQSVKVERHGFLSNWSVSNLQSVYGLSTGRNEKIKTESIIKTIFYSLKNRWKCFCKKELESTYKDAVCNNGKWSCTDTSGKKITFNVKKGGKKCKKLIKKCKCARR